MTTKSRVRHWPGALAVSLAFLSALAAQPAMADFARVEDRSQFLSLVDGRDLTRFGVSLQVTESGGITGRAFGRDVTGDWSWRDGFFCRDMAWGDREIGYNCQTVARDGATLRFTSDRGSGRSADLQLE